VFDYLFARHSGGTFILRIEDTDRTRYVEGSLEELMTSLRWLGMQWDEGPEVGGDYGPYFQSERLDHYQKHAKQLVDEGKAYYCYCTRERLDDLRKAQEAAKQGTGYDRRCRDLTSGQRGELARENPNPVIRFKMKDDGRSEFDDVVRGRVGFDNNLQDDFVAIKADGFPTYHFASVVDDHLMEITHVIRGEEWLSSAPKHLQLYEAFGWTPPMWVHPPLILDTSGKKLSKRSGVSTAVADYITQGYLPDAMLNFLATMGWSSGEDRKLYTREELIEKFTLEGIVNHPAVYDMDRLNDLQGEYVRLMTVNELSDAILPYMQSAGLVSECPTEEERAHLLKVTALIRERLVLLKDAPEMTSFFYRDDFDYEEKGARKHLAKDTTPALLNSVIERLSAIDTWNVESTEAAVREAGASQGQEGGGVIHPVRMAVTGRTFGPGLFELMEVLGRDRCIARLQKCESMKV
jgi:glutamyl-tRNA synthetase